MKKIAFIMLFIVLNSWQVFAQNEKGEWQFVKIEVVGTTGNPTILNNVKQWNEFFKKSTWIFEASYKMISQGANTIRTPEGERKIIIKFPNATNNIEGTYEYDLQKLEALKFNFSKNATNYPSKELLVFDRVKDDGNGLTYGNTLCLMNYDFMITLKRVKK